MDIILKLTAAGISRARVIEDGDSFVRLQVPPKHMDTAAIALFYHRPKHIVLTYEPLPWWRCWFDRFQYIRRIY